ncbi:P-loop containing nucleoside triphosphate hydrolase protein [Annulohypoxylon maeteangense]|uniref:P-loop containing nucleoside triphosphate hydrolase protein n=1 Tax=Annulohypoxylon maeteangense TaxID=1927788 RepID=UPI002008D612|nr:P-loop containing nucleoside triphosphate hydrolase protein [Annulohypoxylon maeteangense]KAI0880453.1 P-loop containing nucleoside triphosphate hydrolase protein [Annulohypoxylon maeteangense]
MTQNNTSSFGSRLPYFFQQGQSLVQGNTDTVQSVITELATEEGIISVREMIDEHIPFCKNDMERINLWRACIRPFFQILTEPRVARSAILEPQTGAIYAVVVGFNATRLEILFNFLLGLAAKWKAPFIQVGDGSKDQFLELCVAILFRTVDYNVQGVNGVIMRLVGKLRDVIDGLDRSFWSLQATKRLDYIQTRLGMVKSAAQGAVSNPHLPYHATFTQFIDLPGALSKRGPRHDNDFEDIGNIRILPTMSELMSDRQDYRPMRELSQLHLPGIQGLIDRHFRLLREDTVGQLKEGISQELRVLENPGDKPLSYEIQNYGRKYSYSIVDVVDTTCTRRRGLEFHLRLKQPPPASEMTPEGRGDWWNMSKRLEIGALVCFLERDTAVFCAVSESTVRPKIDPLRKPTSGIRNRPTVEKRDLHSNADFAYVSLSLAEPSDTDLRVMLRAIGSKKPTQRSLVEFPGVLVPSFKPTLSALKQISKTLDLPFTNLLAPAPGSPAQVAIPPPLYTAKPNFAFSLKCLTSDGSNPLFGPKNNLNARDLSRRSRLDEGQALALLNALKRSLALIQGPPGTGKSYTGEAIIKVLLANKSTTEIGPIICVCRTNHALDQLLENLWHGGVKQIIRIGSRSQSSILKNVNLRKVAQEVERTKSEKTALWKSATALEKAEKALKTFIEGIRTSLVSEGVKEHIKTTAILFHEAIFNTEPGQWTPSTTENDNAHLRRWVDAGMVSENTPRAVDFLVKQDPNTLSQQERSVLGKMWVSAIVSELEVEFISLHRDHWHAKKRHETVLSEVDLRVLRDADIIGATTTGLAKNLKVFRKLDSKVLLCEEAGEVLESHILTALLPSVEHAILIGDHLQLRPHIENYELSVENPHGEQYSLDVSLFERLVKPFQPTDLKLPFDMLGTQRRMHPSISNLIRSTIYHNLKDSEQVSDYPEVSGVKKRLYWFHHEHPESTFSPNSLLDTSRTNYFEVEMICAFVSHLVRQGVYGHDDIAVITPYLGQLHRLRHRLQESFEVVMEDEDLEDLQKEGFEEAPSVYKQDLGSCVRLATVDTFQGEEAKIVIISLVRSNPDWQCGFMKSTNRINVTLSRAKHGMYIFGDSNTYGAAPMWSHIISILKSTGNLGTSLPLQCPRHKDTLIEISGLEDFDRLSPEGGCDAQCLQTLECGHMCPSTCHAAQLHKVTKCHERCSLSNKPCGHDCSNRCGEPCEEDCSTILEGKRLPLPCGHFLTSPRCWQTLVPEQIKCTQRRKISLPGCNHSVEVPCHEDVSAGDIICRARCDHTLSCGHRCPGTCNTCIVREGGRVVEETHQACMSICGRSYGACGHVCTRPCHPNEECPPCDMDCDVQCEHMICRGKCSERCAPCKMDKCSSRCPHSRCTMPCAAPCNWIPCSRRCKKVLQPCGHQCPSLCGEVCPDEKYCQVCASENIKSTMVDMNNLREYRDVDLDSDPCIFPNCGHVMTVSSMDSHLGMSDYYDCLDDGTVIAIKGSYKPLSSVTIKACPKCRGSLRNISRYGRLVRQALLDESTRRFVRWSYAQSVMLERRLLDEQQRLEYPNNSEKLLEFFSKGGKHEVGGRQLEHIIAIENWINNGRYKKIIALFFDMFNRMDHIRDEERPYRRVFDCVEVRRIKGVTSQPDFNPSWVQTCGELSARVILFRCYLMVLSDFIKLRNDAPENGATIHFWLDQPLESCVMLIKLAQATGYVVQEAEGHLFFARLIALIQQLATSKERGDLEAVGLSNAIITKAKAHYSEAKNIVSEHRSAAYLGKELDGVGKMLNCGVFYGGMSAQERRIIYRETAKRFSGTDPWYTCAHGHPFTVADGTFPMPKCPECDAPVGKIDP